MVDLNSVTEATLNSDGQIILTAEDGHGKFVLHFQLLFSAKLYAFHQVKVYHICTLCMCIMHSVCARGVTIFIQIPLGQHHASKFYILVHYTYFCIPGTKKNPVEIDL